VVGWKDWEIPGAGSSSQGGLSSLSTASASLSRAGKNNQEMTSWLHHFLDFKARRAPGDICPCLYIAGHVETQQCRRLQFLEVCKLYASAEIPQVRKK